ncbi:MAG: YHYH protein [Verrucomicrobiota bacterium]
MKAKLLMVVLFVGALVPLAGQGPGFPPPGGGPPPDRKGGPPGGGPPGGRDERGSRDDRGGGMREHDETEAQPLRLVPADERPPARNEVDIEERGDERRIESNGIPAHLIGEFPNRGNPHEVTEQDFDIVIPADPQEAAAITYLHGSNAGSSVQVFGITLDGVFLEPGTAEVWMGRRDSGWNYEALGGAVTLGLDANYGHVQPDGHYHYHGLPIGLMRRLGHQKGDHSPLVGWAADGFPIYALFGYSEGDDSSSEVVELRSSYALKKGNRPGGRNAPDGDYDGAFVQDYEFVPGLGTLDECNGRYCVTPEFPDGTYAYFLTRDWPVIPRAFRGTPEELKVFGGGQRGPGGMRGGPGGPPGSPPPGGRPPRPF